MKTLLIIIGVLTAAWVVAVIIADAITYWR